MRLGRTLIIVAVVLLVLLVVVYMSTNGGDGGTQDQAAFEATQAAQMRPAVVMISSVDQGERITADKIQVVQVFQDEVNEFTFADISQVEGLYARVNLSIGDYVELTLVTDNPISLLEDLGSTHAALIPEGMVAMPIPISRFSSVAYGINRGDHVNIIATMQFVDLDTEFQTILPNEGSSVFRAGERFVLTTTVSEQVAPGEPGGGSEAFGTLRFEDPIPQNVVAQAFRGGPIAPYGRAQVDPLLNEPFYWVGSERQRPRIVSQSVIFNRIILHVGNFPLETDGGGAVPVETAAPEGEEPPPEVAGEEAAPAVILPPDIVTLIVTPQESVALNYLIYSGAQLTLALRARGDNGVLPTDAVTLQYLMDVYRIPFPVKLPYGNEPRIDVLKPPVLINDLPAPTPVPQ